MHKPIDFVVNMEVPVEEVLRRLSGRLTCQNCGTMFNLMLNPPKIAGRCDCCGGLLVQREDDRIETVLTERVCPPADLPLDSGPWTACGPGLAAYHEIITEKLGDALAESRDNIWPSAAAVARLAQQCQPVPAERLEPVYLRNKVTS
jgi:hypothetical protein